MAPSLKVLTMLWPALRLLETKDVSVTLHVSCPVKLKKLRKFEEKSEVLLPEQVSQFYLQGSDGLFCHWPRVIVEDGVDWKSTEFNRDFSVD